MRHDQTNWLIHFVRDRIPEQDFPGETEEEFNYLAGGELECDASAFCVLKTIIRLGGLIPGYSFRKGRTTIYGGHPTVCATEMPIYSFAMYAKNRSDSSKVSTYGIGFLKSEFYSAGGRPVIYGLSNPDTIYLNNDPYCRILDPSILPIHEQYRYVAYNPLPSNWIDWSHEREWRWIAQDKSRNYLERMDGNGCYQIVYGLPLFSGIENEGFFTRLCIIVRNHSEAKQIQEDLTGFYLAGSNNYGTPFDKKLLENSFIVVLEDVVDAVEKEGELNAQTIEGLQKANLLRSIILTAAPSNAEAIMHQAILAASFAGEKAAKEYIKNHPHHDGSCGFAHVVTWDVTNPFIQYLLSHNLASGPYDGRVHINIDGKWEFRQSINYQEFICEAMAKSLKRHLNIDFYMHSRLD